MIEQEVPLRQLDQDAAAALDSSHVDDVQLNKTTTSIAVKIIIGALIGLCLTLLIAVIVVAVKGAEKSDSDSPTDEICVTTGCASAAGLSLRFMDLNADPCEDFFQFTCGGFVKSFPIPDERASYVTLTLLQDDILTNLKGLLEEGYTGEGPKILEESKQLYQSCMDEDLIEKIGLAPLIELTDDLGGWPVIDTTWNEDDFDLVDLLVKLRLYDGRGLINSYVGSDAKDSTKTILQMDQENLQLPSRSYYLEELFADRMAAYRKYFIGVVTAIGTDRSVAEADATAVIELETVLANLTTPAEQRRDYESNYHKMTIKDLYTNISSKIDWLRYFKGVFAAVNFQINNSTELVNYEPKFYTELWQKILEMPNRVLANYLIWRIVDDGVLNLPKRFQQMREEFDKALYGDVKQAARWKMCVWYTDKFLGHATGRLFVNKYFPQQAKASTLSMIAEVRKAFDDLLVDVGWMDDETRKAAKIKASKISEKIGYPEWINNDTALDEKYNGVESDPKTFFKNGLNLLNWDAKDSLSKLSKPYDKEEWITTPAVPNAFYSPPRNLILFPAGILQPPFWQIDRPMSMNFGAIGSIIGHEITHGFDDRGRQFDGDGNLVQWWSQDAIDRFKKAAECIQKQYGGYFVEQVNMTLNGINTQGENIADNGGLKQAHKAYQQWRQTNEDVGILPGFNGYSHDKLFFIAFAQSWCGHYRDRTLVNSIQAGVHSPVHFRVMGTISNSKQFSDTFQCTAGSKMNPVEKCSVW